MGMSARVLRVFCCLDSLWPHSAVLLLGFAVASQCGFAQTCFLELNQPSNMLPTIVRSAPNFVGGTGYLRVNQTPVGTWDLRVQTTVQFRAPGGSTFGILSSNTTSVTVTPSTAVGTIFSSTVQNVQLNPQGDGDYRVAVSASGTCLNNAYPLTPNSPSPSSVLSILRPRITGPGNVQSQYGIWWLGGASDDSNGYYNRATLSVNANGATGSPTWSTGGSSSVSLSCSACNFPLVTSVQPSANCSYDIAVTVNYSGFYSPIFWMNVNAPFYMQSGGLSSTTNNLDGWSTVVPYSNRDRCNYQMPSIALNENFSTFTDIVSNNWAKPTAKGLSGYFGLTWYDQIYIYSCSACMPSLQQNNPPGQTAVDQAQQFWNIGSATVNFGIYVQQNTFRRYTGHGEHLNVLRILY
jgi:hypothetical protein